jgi:hypothetical protein
MMIDGPEREIIVTAYSGYKADERPLSFLLEERRIRVDRVLDRWYGQEHDYFKVLAEGGVYLLKRHREEDRWTLLPVEGKPAVGPEDPG